MWNSNRSLSLTRILSLFSVCWKRQNWAAVISRAVTENNARFTCMHRLHDEWALACPVVCWKMCHNSFISVLILFLMGKQTDAARHRVTRWWVRLIHSTYYDGRNDETIHGCDSSLSVYVLHAEYQAPSKLVCPSVYRNCGKILMIIVRREKLCRNETLRHTRNAFKLCISCCDIDNSSVIPFCPTCTHAQCSSHDHH